MTTKHTPGPWHVHGTNESGTLVACDVGAKANTTRSVALVLPQGEEWTPEEEANARLIAACPSMFSYIEKKANEGDAEAMRILSGINA